MLRPLVRMPTAHRRDPLPFGHVFPPRRERFLHLANRGGVLEDRVIAGPVRKANAMDVRLDQAGYYGAAADVDDASTRWRRSADGRKNTVTDRDAVGDCAAPIDRVDPSIDDPEVGVRAGVRRRCLRRRSASRYGGRCAGGADGFEERSPRCAIAMTGVVHGAPVAQRARDRREGGSHRRIILSREPALGTSRQRIAARFNVSVSFARRGSYG